MTRLARVTNLSRVRRHRGCEPYGRIPRAANSYAAVPLGVLSAWRPGGLVDMLGRLVALVGAAVPSYAIAYGFIVLFAIKLSWFPATGYGSLGQLLLLTVVLSFAPAAQLMRLIWAATLETLGQDYIRTAQSKGRSENAVLVKHALRRSVLPAISALGVYLSYLIGGSVIIETIFGWPGLGQYLMNAVLIRDYPVVQGFVAYLAVLVLAANLFADIALRIADPRLVFGRGTT